jgi:hypothetical protein
LPSWYVQDIVSVCIVTRNRDALDFCYSSTSFPLLFYFSKKRPFQIISSVTKVRLSFWSSRIFFALPEPHAPLLLYPPGHLASSYSAKDCDLTKLSRIGKLSWLYDDLYLSLLHLIFFNTPRPILFCSFLLLLIPTGLDYLKGKTPSSFFHSSTPLPVIIARPPLVHIYFEPL